MMFNNYAGLYALLFLIPFIIVYLIRPRPKKIVIPSLMFLIKNSHSAKKKFLFQKLLKNLIFFIQLLMICFLALAIAQPYIVSSKNIDEKNTVIVIDVSGSSQTKYGQTTRFNKEIEEALKNIKGRTSIIAAGESPTIVVENARPYEAKNSLNSLKPKATKTNIGDAMILAGDLLKGKKGRIIVLSDFISNTGSDVVKARQMLISKGYSVRFIDVSSEAENVGIINAEVDKFTTKIYVKNYDKEDRVVSVFLVKGKETLEQKAKRIMANSVESFSFETPTGQSEIMIKEKDDLLLDNVFYISAPEKKEIKIWLITNLKEGTSPYESEKENYLVNDYLVNALSVMKGVKLYVAKPPIIDQTAKFEKIESVNPDIIIIHKIKEDFLPGSDKIIKRMIEKGSFLIIYAQEKWDNFKDLFPFEIEGKGNRTDVLVLMDNEITKDVEFPPMSKYLKVRAENGSVVFVKSTDNYPLLFQKGNVLYYGILDGGSGFKTTSSYPILWLNIINYLMRNEDIKDYNQRTGNTIGFSETKKIGTPSGIIKSKALVFDEAGFYNIDGRIIAVNMLSEEESDVSRTKSFVEEKELESFSQIKEKEKLYFEIPLIIGVIVLLFIELFLVKMRGDL